MLLFIPSLVSASTAPECCFEGKRRWREGTREKAICLCGTVFNTMDSFVPGTVLSREQAEGAEGSEQGGGGLGRVEKGGGRGRERDGGREGEKRDREGTRGHEQQFGDC